MSSREYEAGKLGREIRAEPIAQAFHEAYERLAPRYGYKTREATAVPWDDVPLDNKNLMRAVVNELIDHRIVVPYSTYNEKIIEISNIKNTWKELKDLLE